MFNVCPACGEYSVEKGVEQDGPEAVAVCPSCHHAAPFLRLPLFVVTGASGAGKSTLSAAQGLPASDGESKRCLHRRDRLVVAKSVAVSTHLREKKTKAPARFEKAHKE
jgi:hypothetical protein